jgi:excinuclease Cho
MRPRVTSVGLILPPPPADFEYPAHINRASLDALPSKPGVYLFLNRAKVPIYIGKSVNIRSRVMAHLRTPEEMVMLKETRRVGFLRTAGEIGALLLESRLIKQYQPDYNILLKFTAESFALYLKKGDTRPQTAACSEVGWDESAFLYGLFASRSAAQEGLLALVRRHMLCPALLGIETTTHGRACFARQIGRCMGACIGDESRETHFRRLQAALEQLNAEIWPYDGPIGIVETEDQWRQIHVVDRWSYIGSLEGRRRKIRLPVKRIIDIDTYKILAKPLADGQLTIAPCEVRQSAAYYIDADPFNH